MEKFTKIYILAQIFLTSSFHANLHIFHHIAAIIHHAFNTVHRSIRFLKLLSRFRF